jgi:Plavaka transposase
MPGAQISELMDIWAQVGKSSPPFANKDDLYDTIDATKIGGVPWQSFSASYAGPMPDGPVPSWMSAEYDVWYRDPQQVMHEQIANPDLHGQLHYCAKRVFINGEMQFRDLMEGTWAWDQSVSIFSAYSTSQC